MHLFTRLALVAGTNALQQLPASFPQTFPKLIAWLRLVHRTVHNAPQGCAISHSSHSYYTPYQADGRGMVGDLLRRPQRRCGGCPGSAPAPWRRWDCPGSSGRPAAGVPRPRRCRRRRCCCRLRRPRCPRCLPQLAYTRASALLRWHSGLTGSCVKACEEGVSIAFFPRPPLPARTISEVCLERFMTDAGNSVRRMASWQVPTSAVHI